MRIFHLAVPLLLVAGCGGGASPSSPTPPTAPSPSAPQPWTLTGVVLSTISQQPLGGAVVQAGSLTSTTNAEGRFTLSQAVPPTTTLRTSITAAGHLLRETGLAWPRAIPEAQIDLIALAPPFSLDLYKQLVRDALESPELRPLYRWTTQPRVALYPFDDSGRPLPPEVTATIRETVPKAIAAWSGGLFENVSVEEVQVPDGQEGWIVLHALRNESSDYCGLASFRYRGEGQIVTARIELVLDTCACGSRKISPNTIAHELAHGLGFWHVEGPYLLVGQAGDGCSAFENEVITPVEAAHARIAYSRPPGNRDPDRDPDNSAFALREATISDGRTVVCR